jgi:ATP-binding cassette subfamily B protein/ATP-binding cassette subfamily C protein/ATP-binding cassette subfamily B multidrug efflux pump
MVFQSYALYPTMTVADNIGFALEMRKVPKEARIKRINEVAAMLQISHLLDRRPAQLSGGQRQRVAIARAMLTDAPLLLLDDALSAVDTQTETDILHHLRSARVGRTALIVSHRLSAVMEADHILVLKGGQVSERGDHASLLELNGWYAAQWRYQQLEASLDAA